MNIEITKPDFDQAVPAAREPKGKVFEVLCAPIQLKAEQIAARVLGDVGIAAVEEGSDVVLVQAVKQLACVGTFLEEMRGLDLVLTATGFGVVSTQDTAPASKQRVDALDGELRRKERLLMGDLLGRLFMVEGWNRQPQRQVLVATLLFSLQQLEQYAGISHAKPEDWDRNVPEMLAADAWLRKHIGNAYMDELLEQLTSASLTPDNMRVALLCQQYIGASVAQNMRLKQELWMRLVNRLEADLPRYPTYAGSEAYRLNHFTPYENHAEDTAFHFVG